MTTVITKRLGYLATAERLLGKLGPVTYCADQAPATVLGELQQGARIVLATKGCVIDGPVLDAVPSLRIVAAPTAGFDWIDVAAATERGIPVVVNTGAAADAVAEFALGSVLALTRRIVEADRQFRAGTAFGEIRDRFSRADRRIGSDLTTSTVAVVGLGHIGMKTARNLGVLRPGELIGYDPYASPEAAAAAGLVLTTLDECFRRADIVLLHVPLTAETTKMVDAAVLSAMKPGALLVNCSRGQVVDETALIGALTSGHLGGAALDVFETEPLAVDSPLRGLDNVILTPHIAGVTAQSDETRAREIGERILACAAGTRPTGLANPSVWETRRPFDA